MISIAKNFLFIHIPKTGGNSIQNILKNYSEDEIVIRASHQDGVERFGVHNKKYNTNKHSTLSHYKFCLSTKVYHSLFKFSVIRNPWDRMISYYFSPHLQATEWNRDNFLKLLNRAQTLRHHICEEALSEKNVDASKKLDSDIDFLIKFENLNEDFKKICKIIDIPFEKLPVRNKSQHEHYSNYYDEELIQIVNDKFHEEIVFMNYKFESKN